MGGEVEARDVHSVAHVEPVGGASLNTGIKVELVAAKPVGFGDQPIHELPVPVELLFVILPENLR